MNDDPGWDKLVDAIDAKFGLKSHGRDERPLTDRADLTERVAFVCFIQNGQEYKLERIARPAIIDTKSHYHKAARGGIRHENVYDPEATSFKTIMYRKTGDDWEEVDPTTIGFN